MIYTLKVMVTVRVRKKTHEYRNIDVGSSHNIKVYRGRAQPGGRADLKIFASSFQEVFEQQSGS